MSGLDKNRKRNQTISFRMSPEERRELEARISVSGMPKGEFFIQSLLHQQIQIVVGKYQSDRLSIEVRRLGDKLNQQEAECEEIHEVLMECKALLKQFVEIITKSNDMEDLNEPKENLTCGNKKK